MFSNLLGAEPAQKLTPIPKVEQAWSEADFKRIELKIAQAGIIISALTLLVGVLTLHKRR